MQIFRRTLQILTGLLASAAIALLILYAPPAAAQADTSAWECKYCPFPDGYKAEVEAGADYVSDTDARFGNVTGYDEKGAYLDLGGEGHYTSNGYQLNWFAEDLGLASRIIELDGGHQGRYGFYLDYSELPYRLFDSTNSVFTATSGDTLTLPSGWVPASLTSGFTALATSLQARNIESDRQTLAAGFDLAATSNFSVFADYRHQKRDGVDIVAGANFIQASLLPRMIDFETDLIDAGVEYANGSLSLSLGWFGSFFKNNNQALTWDNPFTPFPGADQGRLAQEPDNDFQQVSLSGTYVAQSIKSVFAFTAAMGQGTQDDQLLPYSINPTLVAGNLPRPSLDGQVDTTNYALTMTSRPFDKARIRISYSYDERDNQTAQAPWTRVIVDAIQTSTPELNVPYSFERGRLNLGADYRLFDKLRLSAGYDRTQLDRDFQEVAEQTEDGGWGRIRYTPSGWLDITAKGGASRREIDRYDTDVAISFGQNPLLRKYNLAHRYREFGELTVSLAPAEKPFSLSLSALYADDSYSKSELGLTDSENLHISADLSYVVSETASVYLLGGHETIDAEQLGSTIFSIPDWRAVHEDQFDHFGGGIQIRRLNENTDLTLDYMHTDGTTGISMIRSGAASQFPDLDSTLDSLRMNVRYRRSEKLDIDLSLRYESFTSSNWAIDGVEPDTIDTVLTLGEDSYDYDIWVFGLSFRYRIGVN
jgi:MtrB/PioB family decaheme-associated outer membrane protein